MNDCPEYQYMSRRYTLFFSLFLAVACPLYALLNIFYITRETDNLHTEEIFTTVLWVACNLFACFLFFVLASFLVYALFCRTIKGCLPVLMSADVSLIYKYAMNLLIAYLFDGFPATSAAFGSDLVTALLNILLELLELGIAVLVIWVVNKRYRERVAKEKVYSRHIPDFREGERYQVFPYKKLYDRTNPVLASVFYVSLVNFGMRILSLLVEELVFSIRAWAPSTLEDWLYILGEVTFEFAMAAGGYFLMRWFVGFLHSHFAQKQV